jgi:apolipoprotein N-acyltransferase
MGGAICYESIFPKEVLNPQERPEVLVILANDGWYGLSAGPYQHLAAAQMRAVEEGVSVIRSANTGISAVIAPNGDILGRIGLSQKGVITVRLPNVLSRSTLYGQYGNVILLVLLLFGVGLFYIYKRLVKEILKK